MVFCISWEKKNTITLENKSTQSSLETKIKHIGDILCLKLKRNVIMLIFYRLIWPYLQSGHIFFVNKEKYHWQNVQWESRKAGFFAILVLFHCIVRSEWIPTYATYIQDHFWTDQPCLLLFKYQWNTVCPPLQPGLKSMHQWHAEYLWWEEHKVLKSLWSPSLVVLVSSIDGRL